jgi:hypothetical protein
MILLALLFVCIVSAIACVGAGVAAEALQTWKDRRGSD